MSRRRLKRKLLPRVANRALVLRLVSPPLPLRAGDRVTPKALRSEGSKRIMMCMCARALWLCMMNMNMTRHAGICPYHAGLIGHLRLQLVPHRRVRRRCHLGARPPLRARARGCARIRLHPHLHTCRPKGQAKTQAGGVVLLERKLPQTQNSSERKLLAPFLVHLMWERKLLHRGPVAVWERQHPRARGAGGVRSFLVQSGIDLTRPPAHGP